MRHDSVPNHGSPCCRRISHKRVCADSELPLPFCPRAPAFCLLQSMVARLLTFFCDQGTTVELAYGNSLKNIFYYPENSKVRNYPPCHSGAKPSRSES